MHVALVFLFKKLIGHVNYVFALFKKINFSSTQCEHKFFFFYIPVIFLVGATHGKGRCSDTWKTKNLLWEIIYVCFTADCICQVFLSPDF